ncbi:MAG TPA: ATP-binding protein [Steroidobacteraceae bacterium]|nr:ATP-binding protein [Steroidobacteraceae bacterium]
MTDEHQIWSIGLDWLPQPIAVLNAAGMVVYCNRAWLAHRQSNLGGWFVEAFSGNGLGPEARTEVAAALQLALSGADAMQSALYACGAESESHCYRVSLRRFQVKDETYVLVHHEDVTAVRRLEAELQHRIEQSHSADQTVRRVREDEVRWKLALEVNNVAVWDFDALARTVVGSKRWLELWDAREGDPDVRRSGIPLPIDRIQPDELPQFLHDWYELLAGMRPALEVGVNVLVLDDYRFMRLRGRVVERDAFGTALRVVGTLVDIHDARRMQMQAANASKLESIGELAAGIAHEINTPTQYVGDNVRFLGDVFGSLQQCVDELSRMTEEARDSIPIERVRQCVDKADMSYLREEIPKAIAQSLEGIQRIAKIVAAMKEFSHPSQERTPTDLNHAISNTITVATNEWKYVAKVETQLDSSLPQVPVIPGEFNQVILNMVVNAAHAIADTREQHPTRIGTIRIVTRRLPDWAEINISDDGCGMPKNIHEKIFDPFFTTKPVGKGTGQGLAIAHNVIVKRHYGTIAVKSEAGVGTTFTIRVPLEAKEGAEPAESAA